MNRGPDGSKTGLYVGIGVDVGVVVGAGIGGVFLALGDENDG